MSQVIEPASVSTLTRPKVSPILTGQAVSSQGYNPSLSRMLGTTIDDVEIKVDLETYERMENDPTVIKSKKIIVTNVLTDELQFAPGATEKEVTKAEFDTYVEVMDYCKRLLSGTAEPLRVTLEQLLGNAIRYGHGIAELEWEYRYDEPTQRPAKEDDPIPSNPAKGRVSSRVSSFFRSIFTFGFSAADKTADEPNSLVKDRRTKPQLRLMLKSIKVKPRGVCNFVVDAYMNVLGIAAKSSAYTKLAWNEILDRRKFLVLTLNKQDEDPRGKSFYRALFNWYNLKTQLPTEILRFIVEQTNPKAVGTLPEDVAPYEVELDEHQEIVYDDPATKSRPRMIPTVLSYFKQMANFRSGGDAVVPFGGKLEPFMKNGKADAKIFSDLIMLIQKQMEDSLLLQNAAQSVSDHNAKGITSSHKELLEAMGFWIKWGIAVSVLTDTCKVGVAVNFGPEFVKYLPFISLGDFVRRDWVTELNAIADAYFKGFIDDSQRAELCAWLNLPDPGPSRAEIQAQIDSRDGTAVPANSNRPDKQPGNDNRNAGNGTIKKKDGGKQTNGNFRRGPFNVLGDDGKRFVSATGNLHSRPR